MFPWLRDDKVETCTPYHTTHGDVADLHAVHQKNVISDLHGHQKVTSDSYAYCVPGAVTADHHPHVSSGADGLARDVLGHSLTSTATKITGAADHLVARETPEQHAHSVHDHEALLNEKAAIDRSYADEVKKKTEEYRKHVESEADRIRKQLEEQHARDMNFRKEVVDSAFERQRREFELANDYARKELENERQKALDSLEQANMATQVQVKMDTLAGSTVSEGSTYTKHAGHY